MVIIQNPLPDMTNILNLFQYINADLTGGLFGGFLLVTIFMIGFIGLSSYGSETSFSTSMFITMVSGALLSTINIVAVHFVYVTMLLTAVSVLLLYWRNK